MRNLPNHRGGRGGLLFLIVLLLVFIAPTPQSFAAAGIYERINFQGKLVTDTGVNVSDGTYDITFTLYNDPSAGSNLWDETQTVTVTDGLFRVQLGAVDSTIAAVDFNSDSLYLGVQVEADAEMTPRVRFTAVPYAFMAEKVNGLTVTNTTGTFTLTSGKTLTVNNTLTFAGTDSTTITFQGTDTYVGRGTNDILTNKTLTAPKFADLGFLADASGNELLIFDSNASAVNELTISNAATGNGVTIAATGETNVALSLSSKAAGALSLDSGTTGTINLGTSNNAKTINLGTGTAGNTFNIGTNNTTSDTINIGSALDNVAITGDEWSITAGGVLTVVSCSGCGGGAIAADSLNFTDFSNSMSVDEGTTITNALNDSNDLIFNLSSGADMLIQDNGQTYIQFDDGGGLTWSTTSTDASSKVYLDARSVDGTGVAGIMDIDYDIAGSVSGNPEGINLDVNVVNNAAARDVMAQFINFDNPVTTGDANDNFWGLRLDIDLETATSGTVYGLEIRNNANSTSDNIDTYVRLVNAEDAGTTANGLEILSTGGGAITDAVDVSDTEIDNAINAGENFYQMNTLRFLESSGAITFEITSSGNDLLTFGSATGLTLSNGARNTKTITLSPEYPGAVVTAYYGAGTDTNITGTLTSDADTTQGTSIKTYYAWERGSATQHFYTVAVRVMLPKDFSAWATSNALVVNFRTESTTNTNSDLDVRVYNENSATVVSATTDQASGVANTWTTVVVDDSVLDDGASSEWDAADEVSVIYLRMGSQSGNHVQIGDIQLNYLSKF